MKPLLSPATGSYQVTRLNSVLDFYSVTTCYVTHGLAMGIPSVSLSVLHTSALWHILNHLSIYQHRTKEKRLCFFTQTAVAGDGRIQPKILAEIHPPLQ